MYDLRWHRTLSPSRAGDRSGLRCVIVTETVERKKRSAKNLSFYFQIKFKTHSELTQNHTQRGKGRLAIPGVVV